MINAKKSHFFNSSDQRAILIAPLHWGLGHATRCIPLIDFLLKEKHNVILASDGEALQLLQKEFPSLSSIELPSYQIVYPKKGAHFKTSIVTQLPKIKRAVKKELLIVEQLVQENKIKGIISDNRFGVRHPDIYSVYLSHQITVLTGSSTKLSSALHQNIIKKFDACWVPDIEDKHGLSGKLGHPKKTLLPLNYIGCLSRMKKKETLQTIDILVVLSGPEPQRTMLEEKLLASLIGSRKTIVFVQGKLALKQRKVKLKNITLVNYMQKDELELTINKSKLIISRSGYTSIMDYSVLEKKVFFIPTPGQYEQIYLAKRLQKLGIAPYSKQNDFTLKDLENLENYSGLKPMNNTSVLRQIFRASF